MRGVWKLATILGIPVQVHWSFSLLLIWVYYEGHSNGLPFGNILVLISLMLALFGCVVLHEFGHALAARYYGVGTRDITLSPIGGIARLNFLPEKPMHEFVVAIAGPVVNVVIALILLLLAPTIEPLAIGAPITIFSTGSNFLPLLFWLNAILAGFNLLPAFPMDGGRMLRALLTLRLGRYKATMIASVIGRIIAIALFAYAVYRPDIVLGLISIFVFIMATREYSMVKIDHLLDHKTIKDVVQGPHTRLNVADTVATAIDVLKSGKEKSFLVMDEGENLCGVLREKEILEAGKNNPLNTSLRHIVAPIYGAALLEDSIKTVYRRMGQQNIRALPVYDNGSLVGVVDASELNRFLKRNTWW